MLFLNHWFMKRLIFFCLLVMVMNAAYAGPGDSTMVADEVLPVFKNWTMTGLAKGGRIDAVRSLGGSSVLCATRGVNRGQLFISHDNGLSWQFLAKPTESDITCIGETGNPREFYILTGSAEVFGTMDGGKSWKQLATLTTNRNREKYAASYAIMYTSNGTLLVTDTDSDGGHIYRSTDKGATWSDLGAVSKNALYRLEKTGNGIFVNGWAGIVYQSTDDGLTWNRIDQLTDAALFATEYMGVARLLQADQSGNIFGSSNLGYQWEKLGNLTDAADDFINVEYGAVYYSTYTGKKEVYVSLDYGKKWWSIGVVPTGQAGDWLDHGVSIQTKDSVIVLAGTNKGFMLRNAIGKTWLHETLNRYHGKPLAITSQPVVPLASVMTGSLVDTRELDEPEDILVNKGFAYLPCRDGNNVTIIDYRDPKKPLLACSLRDRDILDAFSVAIRDHYLYVLSMTNCRVSVYDIKDPYHPKKVSAITVGGEGGYLSTYRSNYTRLRKLAIDGNYAYVTHSSESKVYILDIRRPEQPAIVSSFHTGDGAFGVLAKGNVLYLAGYGPGSSVIAVDITDKAKPVIKSRILDTTLLKGTCALAISGNTIYTTAYNANTFWAMDISDPLQLRAISWLKEDGMLGPGRVAIRGNTAYVLNSTNNSVAAIDITDPSKMTVKQYLQDPLLKRVYGIAIDGDLLLLAGREARSFVVVDLKKMD